MKITREDGVALLLTLVMLLVVSLLAASLMFTAQSETWSSMNYRLMTQAKYGAEAAIHRATNYLLNTYTVPGDAGDPLVAYTLTASPVIANGQPVVLSSEPSVASNYPVAADVTGFQNNVKGSFPAGNSVVNYTAAATLIAMRQITPYGSATPQGVQVWRITGYGSITGARSAQIEVETVLERQVVPVYSYAAFATGGTCGAMNLNGNTDTDSYDSTAAMVGGAPVISLSGGNVGTNGNLSEVGNAVIHGTLSTPRTGVGNCTAGNVTGLSGSNVTGGLIHLPQAVVYPTPALPNPLPPTTNYNPPATLAPGTYGDISLTGNKTMHVSAGTYNLDSLSMAGNSQIIIDSGPVILNVVTALDMSGNGVVNSTMKPEMLQIQYAGTGNITLSGNAQQAALLYAPNAHVTLNGNGDVYGAVIANTLSYHGNGAIHYDRHLLNTMVTLGSPIMGTFTWKKF